MHSKELSKKLEKELKKFSGKGKDNVERNYNEGQQSMLIQAPFENDVKKWIIDQRKLISEGLGQVSSETLKVFLGAQLDALNYISTLI